MVTVETLEVELSDFTLRCRSLLAAHSSVPTLTRGLEPGEQVVLHDRVRGYWSAHVADLGFEPADTVYRLRLGVRLSEEEAHERVLGRREPVAATSVTKQELLDLLGRLRTQSPAAPAAGRRTDTAL
jgi:hypothetical protein